MVMTEALDVQTLFDIDDAGYAEYVGEVLFDDPAGPAWESLLHRRVIKRTKGALGTQLSSTESRVWRKRQLVKDGEWRQRGFDAWYEKNRCAERIEACRALIALVDDTRRQQHEEHQASQRIRIERGVRQEGYELTRVGPRNNWHMLRRLAAAIYWHRRNTLEAGVVPSEADRKLWRAMGRPVTVDGVETTLDGALGAGHYGELDWPPEFVVEPWGRSESSDDEAEPDIS